MNDTPQALLDWIARQETDDEKVLALHTSVAWAEAERLRRNAERAEMRVLALEKDTAKLRALVGRAERQRDLGYQRGRDASNKAARKLANDLALGVTGLDDYSRGQRFAYRELAGKLGATKTDPTDEEPLHVRLHREFGLITEPPGAPVEYVLKSMAKLLREYIAMRNEAAGQAPLDEALGTQAERDLLLDWAATVPCEMDTADHMPPECPAGPASRCWPCEARHRGDVLDIIEMIRGGFR